MLIYLPLAALFVIGGFALFAGRLPISPKRQLLGRTARVVGGLLFATPLLTVAVTLATMALSRSSGASADSAISHGNIAGAVTVAAVAIALAMNLKRLSVPIQTGREPPELSGIDASDGRPDFTFLNAETSPDQRPPNDATHQK